MKDNLYIWIDFENAPHVWVFKEIISEFNKNGFHFIITARDFSSTIAICDLLKIQIDYITKKKEAIGNFQKSIAILSRSKEVNKYLKLIGVRPILALSHGSRTQALVAYKNKIPIISLDDYEKSFPGTNIFVNKILSPYPITPEFWGYFGNKIVNYPGLKEELYLWNKENSSDEISDIIDEKMINVLFRPESRFSHYYSERSTIIENEILKIFNINNKDINIILLAREKEQEKQISNYFKRNQIKFVIPNRIIKGPALIKSSDIVFSGGGTMIREACVLGVPAYSFFCGEKGKVDEYLEQKAKLIVLNKLADLDNIILKKNNKINNKISKETFYFVCDYIKRYLENKFQKNKTINNSLRYISKNAK